MTGPAWRRGPTRAPVRTPMIGTRTDQRRVKVRFSVIGREGERV
jgi:hypothetical protein